MVKSGACELGITVLPLPREGVVDEPLGWQTFVLVLPPGTESEFPDPVPLESLTGIPLVMGERNTGSRDYVESMLRASGVEPRIAVEVPQRGAVVPMVLSGAGAAILPMRIALDAAQRGAVVRELAPELRRQMGVVHRPGRLTGAASAFLDQTKASLASWDRAVERRMASGLSRIEAATLTVAAVEKRQLEEFRIQSPISRLVGGNDIDR